MPVRNIVKEYGVNQYYHVYNRGTNKRTIFIAEADFAVFLNIFKQRLSHSESKDSYGRSISKFSAQVELVAYCLMPNHYHLLFFLKEIHGIESLMRSAMTAYSLYFNRKHQRVGGLFQGHFLASRIDTDSYFWQVSRYIHLNPLDIGKDPFSYKYSSLPYFLGHKQADWIHSEHYVETDQDYRKYHKFVEDYEEAHQELSELKYILANPIEL
ncbi:MAG: transposase [Candidatus Saccharimonadales bacterium]